MSDAAPHFMAVIGVREDAGLIRPCVDNLRRIGFHSIVLACVEEFAAYTDELAAHFRGDSAVSVVALPHTVRDESFYDFDSSFFGPLLEQYSPDWLYMGDVDEFPVIHGSRLDTLADIASADVIMINRYNHARCRGQSAQEIVGSLERPGLLPLLTKRSKGGQRTHEAEAPRWLLHALHPKVLVRPHRFERFIVGAHGVRGWRGPGDGPVQARPRQIAIAHIPFTSFERFEQKVRNAREHLMGNDIHHGNRAWHWKRWVQCLGQGTLVDEFSREALSAEELDRMRRAGEVRTGDEIVGGGRAK